MAAAAGADVIDVKDPSLGALGEAAPHVVRAVREVTPLHLPVSAALGDGPFTPAVAAGLAEGAAGSGAVFVKLGLRHTSLAEAAATLRAARAGLPPGVRLVVAGFADSARAGSPAPADLPELAAAVGAAGVPPGHRGQGRPGTLPLARRDRAAGVRPGVPRARAVLRARRVAARRGPRPPWPDRPRSRRRAWRRLRRRPGRRARRRRARARARPGARSRRDGRLVAAASLSSAGHDLGAERSARGEESRHALGPRAPDDPARDGRIERPREVRIHHAGKLLQAPPDARGASRVPIRAAARGSRPRPSRA